MRWYFSENGDLDYFTYNIIDTSFIRQKEFENALKNFVSNCNFGLKSTKKYAQCGLMVFGWKK